MIGAMDDADRDALGEAIDLYNRGKYFDSQEILERIHNRCDERTQPLVRSLLMTACGMHIHFHRGGGRGALNLLRQSLIILDDLRPEAEGVETETLYESLFAYVQELQDRKKRGATFMDRWLVPRIRYFRGQGPGARGQGRG
jgi:hypothetical protein